MASSSDSRDESLQAYHIASVLRPAPLIAPTTPCSEVAEMFVSDPGCQAVVIPLDGGGFGLVARSTYLPDYLKGWNRDIFKRRPITQLMEPNPVVVPDDTPVDQVAMLVSDTRPEVLKSGVIITRNGEYAGVGMGLDLLRAVALRAQQANAAKSAFLAHMSHEIRTPLNAVIGNLELLSESSLDDEQDDLARTAHVSSQTVLEIIGELLDLSKIEADRFEMEMTDVDIRRIVADARTIVLPRARDKKLTIQTFVSADVPSVVRTDSLRLRQVLINFLGNACKFTSDGGIFVHVRCQGKRNGDSVVLCIEVIDTGPGFDPARAMALFDPYVQEDASTARRFGGTGLGLAISKRIIGKLGGAIGCNTQPGLGSTFWCTVPVTIVEEKPEPPALPNLRVLVLGPADSERNRISEWLGTHGATAVCASSTDALTSADEPFSRVIQIVQEPSEENRLVAIPPGAELIVLVDCASRDGTILRYQAYRHGATHVLPRSAALDDIGIALSAITVPEQEKEHRRREVLKVAHEFPVLIVDDVATNRNLARRQLALLGLASETAENGLEGLRRATSRRYSLILVDSSMPIMDGPTFIRQFRDFEKALSRPRVPVIAMTAHALRGDAERLIAQGMDDYLPKPVTLNRLEAVLRLWLGNEGGVSTQAVRPEAENAHDSGSPVDLTRLSELLHIRETAALVDVLSEFVAELPQLLEAMDRSLAANDRAALARAAHAAKGAAASAAATRLHRLCAQIEQDAKTGEFADLRSRFEEVSMESERIHGQLKDLRFATDKP